VAEMLQTNVRRGVDIPARYGGEEFVIILVETTAGASLEVAERIRALAQELRVTAGGTAIRLTVSVGVTCCRDDDPGPDAVVARADQALYAAKNAGRNRVMSSF